MGLCIEGYGFMESIVEEPEGCCCFLHRFLGGSRAVLPLRVFRETQGIYISGLKWNFGIRRRSQQHTRAGTRLFILGNRFWDWDGRRVDVVVMLWAFRQLMYLPKIKTSCSCEGIVRLASVRLKRSG